MTLLCRRRLGGLVGALLVLLASGGATEAKPLPAVLTTRGGAINSSGAWVLPEQVTLPCLSQPARTKQQVAASAAPARLGPLPLPTWPPCPAKPHSPYLLFY